VKLRHLLTVLLLTTFLLGCGGGRDKGKYQDYDRPKATEKK